MLNFVLELDRVISRWPENAHWTVAQLADYTNSPISVAVDAVSTTLNREFDLHETISQSDGKQILVALRDRLSRQLEQRQRKIQADRDAALKAYELTMESIRVSQAAKDFRTAYKTLSYFVGRYHKNLDVPLLVSVCGDCIRIGQKSGANVQELGLWMRRAINAAALSCHQDNIEDALDFIDAYAEPFSQDKSGIGAKILQTAVTTLQSPAFECNLAAEWSHLQTSLAQV
jgi:hypothetical protein